MEAMGEYNIMALDPLRWRRVDAIRALWYMPYGKFVLSSGVSCTPYKQFARWGPQKHIRGWVILDGYLQFLGVPYTHTHSNNHHLK